jgi:hypothetical protein
MKNKSFRNIFYAALLSFVVLSLATSAYGQGRGRGGGAGGGRGSGGGVGNAGGPPPGVGVDRGLGNASDRSNGRSDEGLRTASERSNGRSDAGLERARLASNNLRHADRELREHPGIAHALRVSANDLRAGYQAALVTNPDLKFGQYVAATRLARNLNSRFPDITRDAILSRLAAGDSIGEALHDLGLSSHEAKAAQKQAERENKQARN